MTRPIRAYRFIFFCDGNYYMFELSGETPCAAKDVAFSHIVRSNPFCPNAVLIDQSSPNDPIPDRIPTGVTFVLL